MRSCSPRASARTGWNAVARIDLREPGSARHRARPGKEQLNQSPGRALSVLTTSSVKVLVIPTNEELVVAREVKKDFGKLNNCNTQHVTRKSWSESLTLSTHQLRTNYGHIKRIGLIETRGLVALVEGTDAMLKACERRARRPHDASRQRALSRRSSLATWLRSKPRWMPARRRSKAIKGELVSVHVIARPHQDVEAVLPKKK